MKYYNEERIKESRQAVGALLRLIEKHVEDEQLGFEMSSLIHAAVAIGKQEALQSIVIKANNLSGAEDYLVEALKREF